ncbi:unnamed protein product [Symbiodinium sp. CCMP2592]|nr:unnamed protein product [Symbiodinium sp. CCMP2592]
MGPKGGRQQQTGKKQCRLCRQGSGICQQGFRKVHERSDPACRFHGFAERGSGSRPVTQGREPPQQEAGDGKTPQIPFSHMTRFTTRGGLGLHFLPGPLDRWGKREIYDANGVWMDAETDEPLSQKDAGEYEKYRDRFKTRCKIAATADKVTKIVDKYLPALADETRAHLIRFPQKAGALLTKARQIRKKMRRQRKAKKKKTATQPTTTTTPSQGGEEAATEADLRKEHDVEEVDWGSDDSATTSTPPPNPDGGGKQHGEDDAPMSHGRGEEPSSSAAAAATRSHVDVGERRLGQERPRTPSRSPRRRRDANLLGEKRLGQERPRTPSRSPRRHGGGRVHLQPNMWWQVRQVQEHMQSSRESSERHDV